MSFNTAKNITMPYKITAYCHGFSAAVVGFDVVVWKLLMWDAAGGYWLQRYDRMSDI
jgi:hypothetical protein